MQTFDQHLLAHLQSGRITFDDALHVATSPHDFKLMVAAQENNGGPKTSVSVDPDLPGTEAPARSGAVGPAVRDDVRAAGAVRPAGSVRPARRCGRPAGSALAAPAAPPAPPSRRPPVPAGAAASAPPPPGPPPGRATRRLVQGRLARAGLDVCAVATTGLGATSDPKGPPPAVQTTLANFSEVESQNAFSLQNSKLLKVELNQVTIQAKLGSMVAYQGEVTFEHAGSGGLGRMLKKAVSGEGTSLMKMSGSGEVFLADQAPGHPPDLPRERHRSRSTARTCSRSTPGSTGTSTASRARAR